MTKPLYDTNPYDREFTAKVVGIEDNKILLDQTLFFPEQGGQTSDIGLLGDLEVIDVQIKDGVIYHEIEKNIDCKNSIKIGDEISGTIDWNHRFSNMQQHTGEHIFTGLAHNKYGAENVGFHLSDNTVTLDLNIELSSKMVDDVEFEANQVIASNVNVKCYYPTEEELKNIDYRSKKEINGPVRIVEIEGVDICACCAPHVKSTAEVGLLKVLSAVKYKGGTRVTILCGLRALAEFKKKQMILENAYRILNCKEDDVFNRASELLQENKNLKFAISEMRASALMEMAKSCSEEDENAVIFTEESDVKAMRDVVNFLVTAHKGICAVFSGNDESGYNFVVGSVSFDCNEIAKQLRTEFNAKCGGSKEMIQGSVSSLHSSLQAFFAQYK